MAKKLNRNTSAQRPKQDATPGQNTKTAGASRATKTTTGQSRDIHGKEIFDNSELCAQFLRDYSGMDILKDVQPEDIEDVTLRYHLFNEAEHHSDTVKRIRLKDAGSGKPEMPMYLVSLIEHKSATDFNVAMQLLRYMVCIWVEWEKEMLRRELGRPANSDFRYPPILPIVYHEGNGTWTAGMHLHDRIAMADMFADYIPDFTYRIVRNHDYSNDELLERADVMSLLMMLGKIQTAKDFENAKSISSDKVNAILASASPAVIDIILRTVWTLFRKIKMPVDEAENYVQHIKEGDMGYLFENMEEMDIQEERRKTAEARQEAAQAQQELEDARQVLSQAKHALAEKDKIIEQLKADLQQANPRTN